eukprot:454468-Hanusia_phi.AAC.1
MDEELEKTRRERDDAQTECAELRLQRSCLLETQIVESLMGSCEIREFIDSVGTAIFGLNAQGRIDVWNRQAQSLFGVTKHEAMGMLFVDLLDHRALNYQVHSFSYDAIFTVFRQVPSWIELACGGHHIGSIQLSIPVQRRSVSEKFLHVIVSASPRWNSGSCCGTFCICQDFSEVKRFEDRLLSRVKTAEEMADSTTNPIMLLDSKGMILGWNRVFVETTGRSREDVLNQNFAQTFLDLEPRRRFMLALEHSIRRKKVQCIEICLKNVRENFGIFSFTLDPQMETSGQVERVICVGKRIAANVSPGIHDDAANQWANSLRTANAPIFSLDLDYNITEWNDGASQITSFSEKDVVGKSIFEFLSEDYASSSKSIFNSILNGQSMKNFEVEMRTRQGPFVCILLNVTKRFDTAGSVVGFFGIGQDITERKNDELERSKMVEQLYHFIENTNTPIFGVDEDGFINEWNKKIAELTGYSKEELLGQRFIETLIPEEFKAEVQNTVRATLQGISTENVEFCLCTKRKKRIDLLLSTSPRMILSGQIVGLIGVGQDISERKKIEVEKARVADELQRFIQSANAPIFGIDTDGLINEWNDMAAQITGYRRDETLGKDFVKEFVRSENQESVKAVLSDALDGKEAANFEFPLYTKENKRIEFLLNATSRRDLNYNVIGVLGVGQDITERKVIEIEKAR